MGRGRSQPTRSLAPPLSKALDNGFCILPVDPDGVVGVEPTLTIGLILLPLCYPVCTPPSGLTI